MPKSRVRPSHHAGKSFAEKVVERARSIPAGHVATYGDITKAAGGHPMSARSVTHILAQAYKTGITDIPFHRIVYSNGTVWMDPLYEKERTARYRQENIVLNGTKIINFREKRFRFS